MTRQRSKKNFLFCFSVGLVLALSSLSLHAQGKNPVILIPGLTGSELRHKNTGEKVWFRTFKSKSEDLRLPIFADPTKANDDLIATDALRTVKVGILPGFDVYAGFIKAMAERGGYHEEDWEAGSEQGFHDSLYIFAYDWRRDNIENARLLIKRVNALKLRLKKPDLKFDIVAHSMGGLISRYAAMYGDADLPADGHRPKPTWEGARNFDKIILLGTPNEGSVNSLNALVNGYSIGSIRIDLPFVQDSSKFMVFTIPAAYQLLPAPGTLRAFDEKLEPVSIDIYDPNVWSKYGWSVINDEKFGSKFNTDEKKIAPVYFKAALDRGRRFHEALGTAAGKTGGVSYYVLGSDCGTASDSILVYQDGKADKWKTLFRPAGFTRRDGSRVTDSELKKIMVAPGDGIVTKRSLEAETEAEKAGVPSILGATEDKMICEEHTRLAANSKIQDQIIGILGGKATIAKDNTEK